MNGLRLTWIMLRIKHTNVRCNGASLNNLPMDQYKTHGNDYSIFRTTTNLLLKLLLQLLCRFFNKQETFTNTKTQNLKKPESVSC